MAPGPGTPTVEESLARLTEVAEEQLRWQRAAVLADVAKTIDQTLTTTKLRRAYESLDGTRSSTEVAEEVGVSKQAFSAWTRRWRDLGIAHEIGRNIKHLASLRSLGLAVEMEEG